jgi:hypothetical protein
MQAFRHVIFRMNAPVLSGFEGDVGSRTEVRVGWWIGLEDAVTRRVVRASETIVYTHVQAWDFGGATHTYGASEVVSLSTDWMNELSSAQLGGQGYGACGE